MIKLVAIDLDGTLLNEQKLISDENKQALAQAKQQGVKIVLCTGRPLAAMAHYLQELGLVDEGDYSITFNGGLVQKNDTGEIMEKKVKITISSCLFEQSIQNMQLTLRPTGEMRSE